MIANVNQLTHQRYWTPDSLAKRHGSDLQNCYGLSPKTSCLISDYLTISCNLLTETYAIFLNCHQNVIDTKDLLVMKWELIDYAVAIRAPFNMSNKWKRKRQFYFKFCRAFKLHRKTVCDSVACITKINRRVTHLREFHLVVVSAMKFHCEI